jgi:hypothetical protein
MDEHVITGTSAAALAAGAEVLVGTLGLVVAVGATMGCDPEGGGPPLDTWPCAHPGAFDALVLLAPLVLLAAGAVVAARRHRAWPLAVAVVLALACVVGPVR